MLLVLLLLPLRKPGSIEQAHKVDEFIVLDQIKKCLILLKGINNNSTIV